MIKQTQTIRRLLPTNCLSVFDHFVKLELKGLMFSKEKKAIDNHQAFRAILTDLSTPLDYNGPLLFNIFMCDLSLILDKTYFAGYADDNTPYTMQKKY